MNTQNRRFVPSVRRSVPQVGLVRRETSAERQAREAADMASRWSRATKATSSQKGS
jgi:hypothetical protein